MNKREVGTTYEKLVAEYLQSQGYEIIECNFRSRRGEIDIIAKDGVYLVFVEVKYRSNLGMGSPMEAVNRKKQQTISNTAMYYCLTHGYGADTPCRFDVAAVCGKTITVIKNAFEYQGF